MCSPIAAQLSFLAIAEYVMQRDRDEEFIRALVSVLQAGERQCGLCSIIEGCQTLERVK